jgi:Domain of unknown function (DUF222)
VTVEAEPVLVEAARRLDPGRLRRLLGHLLQVADPDGADRERERRHARRGLWLAPTFEGMVAVDGLLEPEAGQIVLAALEPLARPAEAGDTRSGSQCNADALTELARRSLEGGRLPQVGGVRPQLTVIVDLDSLLGRPGSLGGEIGWAGPLDPEAWRRLACDGGPPTWPIWPCCAGRIIGRSMRGAGGWPAALMASGPPPHRIGYIHDIEHVPPPPEPPQRCTRAISDGISRHIRVERDAGAARHPGQSRR